MTGDSAVRFPAWIADMVRERIRRAYELAGVEVPTLNIKVQCFKGHAEIDIEVPANVHVLTCEAQEKTP